MFNILITLSLAWSLWVPVWLIAQPVSSISQGPVHEAFLSTTTESFILSAITLDPPPAIKEIVPASLNSQWIWIPGYWEWSTELNNFIWMTGVWRQPPPAHVWISSEWIRTDKGWVRLKGFWSLSSADKLYAILTPPPDSIEEQIPFMSDLEMFWAPGAWTYEAFQEKYLWSPGRWVAFNKNWILIPTRYVWRPKGYLCIPAYWDWPLEQVGACYSPLEINFAARSSVIFTPKTPLELNEVIARLFFYYPDFLSAFQHHLHFHFDFWEAFEFTPPWWAWNSWWGLTWPNQWDLWWWYTHPVYPNPLWMSEELARYIAPPSISLPNQMQMITPPLIITSKGMITLDSILTAIQKHVTSSPNINTLNAPILPSSVQQQTSIFLSAASTIIPSGALIRPNGDPLINTHWLRRLNRQKINKPFIPKQLITTLNYLKTHQLLTPSIQIPEAPKSP